MPDNDDFNSRSSAAVPGIQEAPPDGQTSSDAAASSLQADLEKARELAQEQRDLYLRSLADFDNYKKRNERVIREQSDAGRRALLTRVLTVLDNLERAAAYQKQGVPAEQLVNGLLATVKQFTTMLEAEGVRPVDLVGKPYDPKVAEAIGTRVEPGKPPNTVVEEARKGYAIGEELLRPAQVVVSKTSE